MACGATADCGGLLRCVDNVCVNPGAKGSAESTRKSSKWGDFKLEGVHGFVGLDLAGGPSMPLSYESGDTADIGGSLLFAFRGGLTFGVGEFGVEFSPMTFRPYLDDSFAPDPNLQLLSYIGTRIPLAGSFYYAMRMGLGIIAVNTPNDEVLFQQRFDLVGFGFNVGHVFFDFHLPSFRHMTDFETGSIFMWQPGMAANYVF